MDYAEWPGIVDMIEGWFNQPIPAKTATMWYAELRHYGAERVAAAFGSVARTHESPFLPALGLVLQRVRHDGKGTPEAVLALTSGGRFKRTDQFQLTQGESDEESDDDSVFAVGLICGSPGCGYTPVLDPTHTGRHSCPLCGGVYVPDGYVLAKGEGSTTPEMV
jgi:hypothetical protein